MIELRTIFVLAAMLLIPGWFALTLTGIWRRWPGLQSWLLAVGISIAFYPVLFYTARFVLPWLTFGPYKMSAMLILMLILTIWLLRRDRATFQRLDHFEWVALVVLAVTFFTRFWIIRDQPYPAWSDSLHHALLTQLTAVQGQLPTTLEPYFPIPLDQYHLGLYALSATVQWIAQVPAHTALLWTAQVLNALCGIGVYLVLDRKVGRVGAIAGLVVVGLLSHQPAFYVNWGRFTQLSSQTINLVACLMVWETLTIWRGESGDRLKLLGIGSLAALLTAGTFLLHFRVAAFFLPLIIGISLWELWRGYREHHLQRVLAGTFWIAGLSLLFVLPALVHALQSYVITRVEFASVEVATADVITYYNFPLSTLFSIGVHRWLVALAAFSLLVGIVRRNRLTWFVLLWVVYLVALGHTYLLGIPLLNVTNLGAVLIMLYQPVGIWISIALQEFVDVIASPWQRRGKVAVVGAVLIGGLLSAQPRVSAVEPFRYFVTDADVAAMEWIKHNTPSDAQFAVNTYFWLSAVPHGTDAGYWIPYFTDRQTTAGMMNSLHGPDDHWRNVVILSELVKQVETDPAKLVELNRRGVDYVYVGKIGNFQPPGLRADLLQASEYAHLVYEKDGVAIFQIQRE